MVSGIAILSPENMSAAHLSTSSNSLEPTRAGDSQPGAEAAIVPAGSAPLPLNPRRRRRSEADLCAELARELQDLAIGSTEVTPHHAAQSLTTRNSAMSLIALIGDVRCFAQFRANRRTGTSEDEAALLLAYVRHLQRLPHKPATILRRLASISQVFQASGLPSPLAAPALQALTKKLRAKRFVARSERRLPPGDNHGDFAPFFTLSTLLQACSDDCVGARDAALLSLAHELGLSAQELIAVQSQDIITLPDGTGQLTITGVSGQQEKGLITRGTAQRIERWRTAAAINDGPLFRRIAVQRRASAARSESGVRQMPPLASSASGRVRYLIGETGLTRHGLNYILRRVAYRAADLGLVDLYGPALDAALAGLSTRSLSRSTSDQPQGSLQTRSERRRKAATVSGRSL